MRIENILLSATATDEMSTPQLFCEALKDFLWGGSGTQYEHFSFGVPMLTVNALIVALAIGCIIASAVMMYKKRVLGGLVRALADAGAKDAESAKTLSELGFAKSSAIKFSLRRGSLGKMLNSAEGDAHDEKMRSLISEEDEEIDGEKSGEAKKARITPYVTDPEKDRYYISEEKKDRLTSLFRKKGSGVLSFVLTVIVVIVIAAVLVKLVPYFLSSLDKAI
jgi:hypothetical protein